MKYQILKQFLPGMESVWVGAIGKEDSIEIFNTLSEAQARMVQLHSQDPTRGFKIVEVLG